MNEQLQGKLVEILSSIQAATKAAGDFAMEQLPDIVQSYVMYGRIRTAAMSVFLLFIGAVMLGVARWAYNNPWNTSPYSWEKDEKRSESNHVVMVASVVLGGAAVSLAVFSFDLLVWIAPKVWLLKELAGLMK